MGREVINLVRGDALHHAVYRSGLLEVERLRGGHALEQVVSDRPDVKPQNGAVRCTRVEENAAVLPATSDDDRPPHAGGRSSIVGSGKRRRTPGWRIGAERRTRLSRKCHGKT